MTATYLVSGILCEQLDLLNLSVHLHSGDNSTLTGLFGGSNEAWMIGNFENPTMLYKGML